MLLQTASISKQFNGISALKNIHFEIEAGEIHGLVGENGAGKSTLIKILSGVYSLDSGQIIWNGQPVEIQNPYQSHQLGITVIHQDRNLIPSFSGIENAYLGLDYETRNAGLRIDWKKMRRRVEDKAVDLGIEIDFSLPASALSPSQRTMLEIVRAMMTDCRLLILDEPTASLTDKESELLFDTIQRLKERNTAVLYVTHRMDEIFRLTQRTTVLKNGEMVGTVLTKDVDKEKLIGLMTDNWTSEKMEIRKEFKEMLLTVTHLRSKDQSVRDASIDVHSGEILGIFGLGGSGRTEFLECIYGLRRIEAGTVLLENVELKNHTPAQSLKSGLVLICEDRRGMGLVTNLSLKQNIVLSTIDEYAQIGIVNEKKELSDTKEKIDEFGIRTEGPNQPVSQLSGGNQQKVVFARSLLSHPKVLLCDEPTQAVDVKTRAEIHRLLRQLAEQGSGIVFVSSDLSEVLSVADRIVVMASGRTGDHIENDGITAEHILSICYQD